MVRSWYFIFAYTTIPLLTFFFVHLLNNLLTSKCLSCWCNYARNVFQTSSILSYFPAGDTWPFIKEGRQLVILSLYLSLPPFGLQKITTITVTVIHFCLVYVLYQCWSLLCMDLILLKHDSVRVCLLPVSCLLVLTSEFCYK